MTIPLALLLISILLIYDFMFLKMLKNRRKRVLFSIYIENGEITLSEGEISEQFLSEVHHLSKAYHPEKVKISCVKNKENIYQLSFSGNISDKFKSRLIEQWAELKY